MVECTCKICNKIFVPAPGHIFKVRDKGNNVILVCSWGCYRKATDRLGYKRAAYQ